MPETILVTAAARPQPSLRLYGQIFKETAVKWSDDNAARLGASLAFYSILSLGPLLVLLLATAGFVFGEEAARGQIVGQVSGLIGRESAEMVQGLIAASANKGQGLIASLLSFATLLIGASGVFSQLQDALNTIWRTDAPQGRRWWHLITDRLLSFSVVLLGGVLLVISLLVSTTLTAASEHTTLLLPTLAIALQTANFISSFLVMTVLFALIFKILPDAKIAWRDVWTGAALTAILFTIGKSLIGLYLGYAGVASTYGAAGSVVVILVWVYYSAQILFLGAEFTEAYARALGSRAAYSKKPAADEAAGRSTL